MVTIHGHRGIVRSVHYSADGKRFATGSDDGTAVIWDDTTLRPLCRIDAGLIEGSANTVKLSPDGRRLLVCTTAHRSNDNPNRIIKPGQVLLFDAVNGNLIKSKTDFKTSVWDCCFAPDGKTLAICDGDIDGGKNIPGKVEILSANDLSLARTLTVPTLEMVSSVAYSPDGSMLAATLFDGKVVVWTLADGGMKVVDTFIQRAMCV